MLFPTKEMKDSLARLDTAVATVEKEVVLTAAEARGFIRVCTSIATRVDAMVAVAQRIVEGGKHS